MQPVIVDYETGEIVDVLKDNETFTKVSVGDIVVKNNSVAYLKNSVNFINQYNFVKVNVEACKELSEYGKELVALFNYISFQSGVLCHSNGKTLTPRTLARILKKSNRAGYLVIKNLIDEDIIHKHKNGKTFYYTFNPWIAVKGKRISKILYDEFCTSKWANMKLNYESKDWSNW